MPPMATQLALDGVADWVDEVNELGAYCAYSAIGFAKPSPSASSSPPPPKRNTSPTPSQPAKPTSVQSWKPPRWEDSELGKSERRNMADEELTPKRPITSKADPSPRSTYSGYSAVTTTSFNVSDYNGLAGNSPSRAPALEPEEHVGFEEHPLSIDNENVDGAIGLERSSGIWEEGDNEYERNISDADPASLPRVTSLDSSRSGSLTATPVQQGSRVMGSEIFPIDDKFHRSGSGEEYTEYVPMPRPKSAWGKVKKKVGNIKHSPRV